jgi:hypothetical protein
MIIASASVVTFALANPAGATTITGHQMTAGHELNEVSPGRACIVRATAYALNGQAYDVTASSTACYPSLAAAQRASRSSSNVNVGYGCDLQKFSTEDTCWFFAVPGPGCTSSRWWVWKQLGAMNNDMESWKAINTCHSGRVYSQPDQKGHHVDCERICNSLGSNVNNHDESLLAAFTSEP